MHRRSFLKLAPLAAAAPHALGAAPVVEDDLRITGVRLVTMRPRRPVPRYEPAPGSWSTGGVEVANPVSIYPKYKPMRSLFRADGPRAGSFWVEIETNKGVKGYGPGGPGGGVIVEDHLTRLLMGENPLDNQRLWAIMWRSTMSYGRKGVTVNAISGVDIALWDIAGKVLNAPVWRMLGGRIHPRIPCYCTGNDIEQHVEFGYKRLKLALPYGPADGRAGIRKNVELVKRAREAVGRDGDVMMDCWMALTERYTLELAEAFRTVQRLLDRGGATAGRLRGLRPAARANHINPDRHWRACLYALRIPAVASCQRGGDLAAGHPLVRRHERADQDRAHGGCT